MLGDINFFLIKIPVVLSMNFMEFSKNVNLLISPMPPSLEMHVFFSILYLAFYLVLSNTSQSFFVDFLKFNVLNLKFDPVYY